MKGAPILVIDDNAENLDLIAYLLTASGYAPRLARSGDEGVRMAIREEPPDLILLDIRMPDMDGFAVAAALRPLPSLRDTRIVRGNRVGDGRGPKAHRERRVRRLHPKADRAGGVRSAAPALPAEHSQLDEPS